MVQNVAVNDGRDDNQIDVQIVSQGRVGSRVKLDVTFSEFREAKCFVDLRFFFFGS
jgi:hypothetical protein